jgi:predicted permease
MSRLWNSFRRSRLDRDLEDELRFHLEERTRELVGNGLSPAEAAREARRRFGSDLRHRDASHDVKVLAWIESLLQDVQFGLRLIAKSPALAAVVVLSMGLSTGAATAAFSLLNAAILRPLPVRNPSSLIYLSFLVDNYHESGQQGQEDEFSYPMFRSLRDSGRARADLFAVSWQTARPILFRGVEDQDEMAQAQWVSGDAFSILGIRPAIGRTLTPDDDLAPGQHPVAVISYGYWSRRFGKDPRVLGRWFQMRDQWYQIVGVAERGFTGTEPGIATDVFMPTMMFDRQAFDDGTWSWFRIWGRLKAGCTPEQTRELLQPSFTSFRREPASGPGSRLTPEELDRYISSPLSVRSAANGPSELREHFEPALLVLTMVIGLVLLIACANVANLLLARAETRHREIALRISIGAGRRRVIQQMLVESSLLGVASCAIGVGFARWAGPFIVGMLGPSHSPVSLDTGFDARMLAFVAGLCALATLLFGTAPALRSSTIAPAEALKSNAGRHSARLGLARWLVGTQVALCFLVLFLAGLFLHTFYKLSRVDFGFNPNNLIIAEVDLKAFEQQGQRALSEWHQLRDRISQVPGVTAVSASGWPLFSTNTWGRKIRVPGLGEDLIEARMLSVSPGFFENMQIRIDDGREFSDAESSVGPVSVAVVNQEFRDRCFGGATPVGGHIQMLLPSGAFRDLQIVGLAGNAKYNSVREAVRPTVYLPLSAANATWQTLEVRTRAGLSEFGPVLGREIKQANPAFRVLDINTQTQIIGDRMIREQLMAVLSSFFAVLAGLLAGIGLYGVLGYTVAQRTREIGIRLALGSGRAAVVRLVVRQLLLFTIAGLAAGSAAGVWATRLISDLLYGQEHYGVWAIARPAVALLLAVIIASLPPVLRAVGVDPAVTLRYE